MELKRKNDWVKPRCQYPLVVAFDKNASRFTPFLFIVTDSGTHRGISYVKDSIGNIIQCCFWSNMPKKSVNVTKGTLVLIDEFEKQGGCEDDLWR